MSGLTKLLALTTTSVLIRGWISTCQCPVAMYLTRLYWCRLPGLSHQTSPKDSGTVTCESNNCVLWLINYSFIMDILATLNKHEDYGLN